MVRLALSLAVASVIFGVAAAAASPPSPDNPAGRENDILGIVPPQAFAHGGGNPHKGGGGPNLVYHGGPVLNTNHTVAIYWGPAGGFASGYQSTINQYFTDVAGASGQTTNVYSVLNQYYDGSGNIAYSSTFDGVLVDTDPYPANGCSDTFTSICLSDSQFRAELQKMVKSPNADTTYFVFTAKGVGSCYSSGSCAFSQYCAYHSNVSINGTTVQYANQPYADTVPAACDAGYHPNGASTEADATINVVSHEHRESINDPLGNAWYDNRGYEGSDKCAWNFGSLTGPDYNQTINGHNYILQQEWSNAISGCALHG